DDELAPVIQQNVLVDGAVVFHRQVVAETDFYPMENLYVLAAMLEDVARQHAPHAEPQPMIQARRRAVKHHPEPYQRLALGIFFGVSVSVIFWFQRRIARIEVSKQRLVSERI